MARELDQLPIELLLAIARYLPSQSDINALVQANRTAYNCLHFFLCQHNVRHGQGSALLWAAQHGYTGLATKLLDAGLEIASFESPCEVKYDKISATEDLSKVNPLLMSAQAGHMETLKLMLSEKRSSQACSPAQLRTVLHWAIRSHHERLVELMIEHKAPLDPAGNNIAARSALGVAVCSRFNSMVSRLLELGARSGEHECQCPVEQAICTHQPLLVEILIKHRIRMNCDGGVCYIASRGNKALLQLLIDYGLDLEVYGGAALLYAIKEGHYDMTKMLIDNGADPNLGCHLFDEVAGEAFFYSAIGFAIHFERLDILKFLLEKGVLPGDCDLFYLERYSEETRNLLSKVPKESLAEKLWIFNTGVLADLYFYDRIEKDPNFRMPALTTSIHNWPPGV